MYLVHSTQEYTAGKKEPTESELRSHSSDSDVPCTSAQARQRLQRRLARCRQLERQKREVVINACRDFSLNPDLIIYSVDNGPVMECSVLKFQIRFFSCTEVIFPRVTNISHGEYCNGKWLDLLSLEFVEREGLNLLCQFSQLFDQQNLSLSEDICQLSSSVLTARMYLNNARLSHLIHIFNDIRWLFEYLTCSEYTVWFLLPSIFGNFQDISKISTNNINFDLLRTQFEIKQTNSKPFNWLLAEKHVQELFLVAVQLSFGYHCQQNIIYLHNLKNLENRQSFELLNFSLINSSSNRQLFFKKNYFQRIFNICCKLQICCVLEYCGGLAFYPKQAFVVWGNYITPSQVWEFNVKDSDSRQEISSESTQHFLQQLKQHWK
ncbi:orientation disruptor [Cochliomyia hominivorax]